MRLIRYGHVVRKEERESIKRAWRQPVKGRRSKGRQRQSGEEYDGDGTKRKCRRLTKEHKLSDYIGILNDDEFSLSLVILNNTCTFNDCT